MLKSMTAYGQANKGNLVVEIHSVNRKYFDVNFLASKELLFFEMEVRKALSKSIERGQVTVRITFTPDPSSLPLPSLAEMKQRKKQWEELSHKLSFHEPITLSFLLSQLPESADAQKFTKNTLNSLVREALVEFEKMRIIEGKALEKDLLLRVQKIGPILKKIERSAAQAPAKLREKILTRLKEFAAQSDFDERIAREVAIYAEKLDIAEEITRLSSHLEQFVQIVQTSRSACGKQLDFLLQEMFRESNTMSNKSSDIEITRAILSIKGELEKMREQMQNVE